MRSRWYLAVAVWMGCFWSSGFALAATMDGVRLQIAQADPAPLMIEAGDQNPLVTLEITDGVADLTALQVALIAIDQDVLVDTVTIGFGVPFGEEITTGNEDFLDVLRARLIVEDLDVNGMQDAGETLLGTQSVTDLEDPATVAYPLDPPLTIPAGTTTTLLVVIDVNQPATQSAGVPLSRQLAMVLLCFPFIAGAGYVYRRHPESCRIWILLVILLGGSLMVVGCTDDNSEDELRFVVNLPSNGLTNGDERLGPETSIAGTTILLMQ